MPSADYIWPHTLNKKVREVVTARRRRDRGRGVLPARPHRLRAGRRRHHVDWVPKSFQHDRSARAHTVPRAAAPRRFHSSGRPHRVHLLRRELPEPRAGRAGRRPVRVPRLLPGRRRPVQHRAPQPVRGPLPGSAMFTAGSACWDVPGAKALGVGRQRGRVAEPGRRDRGPRPRPDRARVREARPRWCRGSTTCG